MARKGKLTDEQRIKAVEEYMKGEEELTEADKLRMENKILQAKIKDQEMEIAILKKLRELRGGGR